MNKSLYYIECTCIRDCHFPNVSFKVGEVVYFNKKASSNEMYVWNRYINPDSSISQNAKRYTIVGNLSYLPFTRLKKNAKKWEKKNYAEKIAHYIDKLGDFVTSIKEIKVTYEEEEVETPNQLELVRKVAEKTIGYNIKGLKAMTEQESYEWHKKHSRIDPKTGDLIISDDEIGDGSYESIIIINYESDIS